MFADLARFEDCKVDGYSVLETIDFSQLMEHRVALIYMNRRDELISNLFRLGRKFKQRQRTIHVAATLMDAFFFNRRA